MQTSCLWSPTGGTLANKYLKKWLNEYGFYQSKYTNGLWKQESHPITFTLVVDNFGVKYIQDEDVQYLKEALKAVNLETGMPMFEISVNMAGNLFIRLTMDWDYKNKQVCISMPGYCKAACK